MILSLLLFTIFIILGIIHVYWAIGGHWAFDIALPTNEKGKKVLNPRKFDSAVVGLALTIFGLFYLQISGLISFCFFDWMIVYGRWIIPSIFILRAVGEFRYVGLFKKIKQTEFGKLYTVFFSPLCLGIGMIGLAINIMK